MNRLRNAPLTDYQRSVIKHLLLDGKSPQEIQQKTDLQRADQTPILLSTVKYWAKRLAQTGDVQVKRRRGRPKLLNQVQEEKMVDYIKRHSRLNYPQVMQKTGFEGHRRTLNKYALKNKIRKFRRLICITKVRIFRLKFIGQWLIKSLYKSQEHVDRSLDRR